MEQLLKVKNLTTSVLQKNGAQVNLVEDVSFILNAGESIGVVGESGSGKTMTALSIMRLFLYAQNIKISGEVNFKGRDLLKQSEHVMRNIRGKDITMIFQEPMTSLNPVYTIGRQLTEMLRDMPKKERKNRVLEMMKLVEVPSADSMFNKYPHEYSGGMRQRAMIAMALSTNPSLLIADEPTTALDVTIQLQILQLIRGLVDQFDAAFLLITHDLGVIAEMVERVIVMYAGKIVEEGGARSVLVNPLHPYTAGLTQCIPDTGSLKERLDVIKGEVPTPFSRPAGCVFHTRCSYAIDKCFVNQPPLVEVSGSRKTACWRWNEFYEKSIITA